MKRPTKVPHTNGAAAKESQKFPRAVSAKSATSETAAKKSQPTKVPHGSKAMEAAKAANAAAAAAQVARFEASKPAMLELAIPKSLPAPVKQASVENAKDIEWVSVRLDVLQACLLVAPKKDSRAALGGVYLHASGDQLRAVATNGHTLLLHSSQTKDLHLPTWLDCGLILPREGLAIALGVLAKLEGGKDATTCQIGWARGHGYAIMRDAEEQATFRLRRIDAPFPEYQKLIEAAGQVLTGGERLPLSSTSYNGEFLKQAAAVGKVFDAKGLTPFAGNDPKAPAVVSFFGEPGALFIIMPLVSSGSEQLPTQTMALIGKGLGGTLAALKATQTRQKKQMAESRNENEKKSLAAGIALRDGRIADVVAAMGKLLAAPKAA